MKYLLKVFFAIAVIFAFCGLAACGGGNDSTATKLTSPSNFRIEDGSLCWDEVEDAEGYAVFIDGMQYLTIKASFDLSYVTQYGTYHIGVVACGGDLFEDSDRAYYEYIYKRNDTPPSNGQTSPEQSFLYNLLPDGSGYEVFRGSNYSGKLIIPDSYKGLPVKRIAPSAFKTGAMVGYWNTKTEEVVLPDTIEEIGMEAFAFCVNLKQIEFSNGLKIVDKGAFQGCKQLLKVTFQQGLVSIRDNAFKSCTSLESVSLSQGVQNIGESVFEGCYQLMQIILPDGLESIGKAAFKGCFRLNDVSIPNTVTSIEEMLFYDCTSLTNINFPKELVNFGPYALQNTLWYEEYPNEYVVVCGFLLGFKGRIMDEIPSDVTQIVSGAFSNYPEITATDHCRLEKAVIPAGVVLGEDLFYFNSYLRNIIFKNGITEIPAKTCYGCINLENVEFPATLVKIGQYSFASQSLSQIELPAGLEVIDEGAFKNSRKLLSISFPESLYFLGADAFAESAALKALTIPRLVTKISDRAFFGSGIEKIIIAEGVSEIGKEAFSNCNNLGEISFPDTLKVVGSRAFAECNNLRQISLPENVEELGNGCFGDCDNLAEVVLPTCTTDLRDVFARSTLKKIVIPEGVETLQATFSGCAYLEEIVLPLSIKEIGGATFSKCSALTAVYYHGTKDDWTKVLVSKTSNGAFDGATLYFYSEKEPNLTADGAAYDGNYWRFDKDGKTPISWKKD